ncbi:mRNA cleavage and polyadenylation factor CLP1 [Nakaseomyces bracarensis]|uniref:Polynucleotide 5'-hydroxyl-kinase GRC3 n=1 Tax=Nakaseomyces bracarensis TaxID=273131 RepID=A0ABR4NVB4_9SACH
MSEVDILPGLEQNEVEPTLFEDANQAHKLTIPANHIWRVELGVDDRLSLQVTSGVAEIFGTELANNVDYSFWDWKFGIYAVEETEIEWKCAQLHGKELSIVSNTTAHVVYNLHFALEKMRSSTFDGPRVMVVGERNTGKTALCRTLASYAIKHKPYQPLFINLNPVEAIFSPPGCITATPVSSTLDAQLPRWGESMTSGATKLHGKQPMIKNFGFENINDNREYYKLIVNQLSNVVKERLQNDPLVHRSGCIIDTPPLENCDEEYSEITNAIRGFRADYIIILCNDDESGKEIFGKVSKVVRPLIGDKLLRVPKITGVFQKDDIHIRALQRAAIREYFYGDTRTVLSPYNIGCDTAEITIWKPKSALQDENTDLSTLIPATIDSSNLQYALIAITYAPRKSTPEDVLSSPILGFGLVTEFNEKRKKLRILLPVPGRLPSNAMILTAFRYLE